MSDIIDKSYVKYLFERFDYDQDKPLYIDPANPERKLSSRQIKTMISQIVAGLKHFGLRKGDPVCVMALNDVYYTPLYLGIMAAGGIFTGTNPGYTAFEVEHHLRLCKVRFMVASVSSLDVAKKASNAAGLPTENIFVFNPRYDDVPFDCQSWWRLIEHGEANWEPVSDPVNEPCCYISSSGTSGLPKAVVVPHKYLENQVAGLVERELPYKVSRLICIPPFAGYNVPSQHGAPIKAGEPVYIMSRYEVKGFLIAVKTYKITETLLLPPILLDIPSNQYVKGDPEALMPLRQIFCGGAAIGKGVQSRMYTRLHRDARIAQIYGMTEVGWTCGSLYPEKDETGSVGRPLKSYQIKIVDDSEVEITKPEVKGEIFIKAAYPMLGYLNDETATMAAFAPCGWIRTGDIGKIGTNGLYYITDRKKDVIKVRGWQVSPAELEEVLLMHPDIKDAAVIGSKLPEPSTDEVIQAYVVRKDVSHLTAEEVKAFMVELLVRYKVPEEVYFLDVLPRNPTGKIIRRSVRPRYLQYTRRRSELEVVERLLNQVRHGEGMDTQVALNPLATEPSRALTEGLSVSSREKAGSAADVGSQLLRQSLEDQVLRPGRSSAVSNTV